MTPENPITAEEAARRARHILSAAGLTPPTKPSPPPAPPPPAPPESESPESFAERKRAFMERRDKVVKAILLLESIAARPEYSAKDARSLLEAEGVAPEIAEDAIVRYNETLDSQIASNDAAAKRQADAARKAKMSGDYYDAARKEYLVRNDEGVWLSYNESQYKRILRFRGASGECRKKENVSEIDRIIVDAQNTRSLVYAGQLAGWPAGVHDTSVGRILVTRSAALPEPAEGPMDEIWTFFDTLLESDPDQLPVFMSWLKLSYETLRANSTRPGQAVVIAGPKDCGKSLAQRIITVALGNRMARPYQYMAGRTEFNADLFDAEHLAVEDDVASSKLADRRAFGAKIKEITANSGQRLHAKGRNAVILPVYWRISVTVNDEPENLMILPPMDESLSDKIIILHASSATLPDDPGRAGGFDAVAQRLFAQIPALLHYLQTWEIPEPLRARRYGLRAYQHPSIMQVLSDLAPEARLAELIDVEIFGDSKMVWCGTARALETRLVESDKNGFDAKRLLHWTSACGTYLARLAKRNPERYKMSHHESGNEWTILPPSEDQ